MKNYPKHIKNTLYSVIRNMAKHPEEFCRCPEKDFTPDRKLPFGKLLSLLVKMGGHSLRDEMLDCLKIDNHLTVPFHTIPPKHLAGSFFDGLTRPAGIPCRAQSYWPP